MQQESMVHLYICDFTTDDIFELDSTECALLVSISFHNSAVPANLHSIFNVHESVTLWLSFL